MGIKKKQKGIAPTFPHRWQELATNEARSQEARQAYMDTHPKATLIESHRAVTAFQREYKQRYRSR